ncbi:mercuric reductase [Actinomycetospora corticicola]|uniref:Pyruvate/2-oxoglutarate dehydrogenase complex dihydrolipoamide dehydrogenase (E3) component n=1 Tax=Actinomycetospora corticicola TaxID=663602 RepID=A0A7Y9E0Q3_9PSEU|nr:FAD-dependent oxidoreductase [Actinomycetospora corticicola]NYD38777.1 pyruvate/2-oxoglutarate dehydrogenase complex dihydrolipoamide dehydrogenase (E3) component [Actinomycetospora corticicola]
MTHDLLVIGAGAGGLSAARAGVRAGLSTALVTDGPIGGDCTFTGCVPSKTLLAAAAAGTGAADTFARVRATVARVAATETATVLRGEGVDVVEGRAGFTGDRRITVGGSVLSAPRVVLATGADPLLPDLPGLAAARPLTTDTVFALEDAPQTLVVLGAGPAGCELAQAFARLGTTVTLVDRARQVLPGLDADAGAVVADALRRDGVDLRPGTTPDGVEALPGDRVRVAGIEADRLLVVAGRRPTTTGLALDRAGVAVDLRGAVVVDGHLATTAPGVFAVGDVTGLSPLTHAADEMGRLAVGNLGRPRWRRHRFRADRIPRAVFTDPEVATVGLPEDEAGPDAWVAEIPLSAVDRAVTAGREDGFVRLVAGPLPGTSRLTRDGLRRVGGGRLLGATIVAAHAGEMIAEVALAMRIGAVTGRLAQTVHAYPTWTLAVRQAAAALATGSGPGVTLRRAGRR